MSASGARSIAAQEGRAVWLGAVTFDRGVGLSHDDGRVTHHIAPDIDAERDLLTADLRTAKVVETIYEVTGIGPTVDGHNGEGDPYYTDGEIKISVLVAGCNQHDRVRRRARQSAAGGDEEYGVGYDCKIYFSGDDAGTGAEK